MEALGFILQRFYYGLVSGCVVNFFIIANVYLWFSECTLPPIMKGLDSLTKIILVVFFIVLAVIISIFLEGISEVFSQKCIQLQDDDKQSGSSRKKNKIYTKLLCYFFNDLGVYHASEERKDDPRYHIIDITNDSKQQWVVPYEPVYMYAKIIEQKEKNTNIYRFRDMSFLIQVMLISFMLIFLFSGIALIPVMIIHFVCKDTMLWKPLIFYAANLFGSFIFFFILPPIASKFADRFIRDVGRTYMAYKLKEKLFPIDHT